MGIKGEDTRQKIIDKAAELFLIKGFNATSIRDLLEATGLTKGCLYFHFKCKDDIGLEYLRQASEKFMLFLDQGLQGSSGVDKLDNFLIGAFTYHNSRDFVGGCLFGNTALETSDTAPDFAKLTAATFHQWRGKLTNIIQQAQEEGGVINNRTAEDLAEFVIATLEGGIMQSRLNKSEAPMKNCVETLRALLYTTKNK